MSWQTVLKINLLYHEFILDYMEAHDFFFPAKNEPEIVEGIVRTFTDEEKNWIHNNGPEFTGIVHNGIADKIYNGITAHRKMQEDLQ